MPINNQRGKAGVIVLLALLILGGAFAAWYFFIRIHPVASVHRKVIDQHIPASAKTVGGVDLTGLMNGPLKQLIAEEMPKRVKVLLEKAGIELGDVKTLTFGVAGAEKERHPAFVIVARAVYDADKLQKMVTDTFGAAKEEIEGVTVMATDMGKLAFAGGRELIVGSPNLVDEAVRLTKGKGSSASKETRITQLRGLIDEAATFWLAGELPDFLESTLPLGPMSVSLSEITHAAVSVDIGSRVDVKIAAFAEDTSTLAPIVDLVKDFKGAASLGGAVFGGKSPEAKILLEILNTLELDLQGNLLTASFAIRDEVVQLAIDHASKLLDGAFR